MFRSAVGAHPGISGGDEGRETHVPDSFVEVLLFPFRLVGFAVKDTHESCTVHK